MAKRTYEAAVELFAMLCKEYGLNPLTDIISHREGHAQGVASNDGDPEHLWNGLKMAYTMDTFRQAVKAKMNEEPSPAPSVPETSGTISKLPDAMKRTVDYYLAIGCDRLAAEYYAGGRKRLTGAKANPDFTLTLTYEEREERIYDCKPLLDKGGVFVHLRIYENFARVFIEYGAVCWDIDPNVRSSATSETSPKSTLLRWRIFPRSTSAMRYKKVKLALS